MLRILLFCCMAAVYAQPSTSTRPGAKVEDVAGSWQGTLDTGATKLRVAFHIRKNAEGQLTATLDSIDQGAREIAASSAVLTGQTITLEFKNLNGRFTGDVAAGRINGSWEQNGNSIPLTLTPAVPPKRPQTPKAPFPYEEVEVSIPNETGGNVLAGTLTLPAKKPAAAVLLLSGSGAQDRDETLFGHKPFAVIADHLTRAGIAVLRVDDRGTGKSTGNFASATIHDFVTDAKAAFTYLRSHKSVDPKRTGLLGHSEGGIVGTMLAKEMGPAFLVLLASPGEAPQQVLIRQAERMTRATGAPAELIERNKKAQTALYDLVRTAPPETLPEKLKEEAGRFAKELGMPEAAVAQQVKVMTSPWFRAFLRLEPLVYLKEVRCPVLALNGEKDMQVEAAANLALIDAALKESGTQHEVRTMRGLNHLFQTAETGLPSEYASIEQTMDEQVLKIITDWIGERTRK